MAIVLTELWTSPAVSRVGPYRIFIAVNAHPSVGIIIKKDTIIKS